MAFVIFLDFHLTVQGLPLVDYWPHVALTKIKCIPIVIHLAMYHDRDTLQARDQSVVESGVTEGGKNTTSFLFRERTQQHKRNSN